MKKYNIQLITLFLLLQILFCAGFAQTTDPCKPQEPQEKPEEFPPQPDPQPVEDVDITSEASRDPNEIIGLIGYDAVGSADTFRWVSATQTLAYTIYFENDAELAMASASKVTINVPLHEKLNFATLGIGSFGFGNHLFAVEGSPSSYQTRIDLRDSLGIFVDVVAGLDIVHNEAFWIFQSIDPATGLPPIDIHRGFLPINDSLRSGEGFVSFTIKPKADQCVTGDTVSATASIVFDVNEPIPTNTWVNTIDAFQPTSTLNMVPNGADQLVATFSGEDDEGGCGVKQFKLYYSVNNNAYQLYDVYPVGDTAEILLESGSEYQFFVLAEDNVGNCEPMKSQSEYNIGTNYVTLAVNAFPQEAGTVTGGGGYTVNDTAVLSATAAEGYHFVNWMFQGAPVSTQNPYSVVVAQNQTYTAYLERNTYTLNTLAADGSAIIVTDLNGNEIPSGSTVLHAEKFIVETTHEHCYDLIGGFVNDITFTSGDTLTVTSNMVISTQTLPLFNASEFEVVACDNYTWNDSVYEMSGDYIQHFTNTSGCDSMVTLHLTVNYSNTGDTSAIACDSYDWYEHVGITTSGEYTHTFTNASSCDSVVTLHLTVNHSNTGDTSAVACDSFDWYEHTGLTTSGDYTHTFTNVSGCDSVVTLHLTVNYSNTGDTTVIACDSYDWYEHVGITTSGDYTHTFTNTVGCDSVVTLHLTVNYSNTADTTAVACDSFDWYEHDGITTSGEYTHTFTNSNGCDSIVTLHLTVNHSNTGDTTTIACDSYDWYEHVGITTSGEYTHTFTNASGCDSVVILHLTVNHSNTGDTTATACDSFAWYGTTYTQSGSYQSYQTNAAGCDSVVTLHLTIYYSNTGDTTAVACNSFTWNGNTYTQSGDYTSYQTTVAGCDSVVTLHLTLAEAPTLQAISGETAICINQFATYYYDASDPDYHYRWFKDNALWAENVPQVILHEMNEGDVLLTMQVADEQLGCLSDTSLLVQVVNHVAPDTTEIRRMGNTNMLVCRPVSSEYGEVHYRWGYTDLNSSNEVTMPGDHNYCLYDFGIDTLNFRYWVETYLNNSMGNGCDNRSYYGYSYITSLSEYDANTVTAYISNGRIVLYVNALLPDHVSATVYDVNGKLLITRDYGVSDEVSDVIPAAFAPGVYFLKVNVGNQSYSFKLLKM